MKKPNNHGISLIEIVVTIAIIGILSAIAVPNIIGWRGARKLDGAARNFMADMELARIKAIREAEDVSVVFDLANNSYQIFVDINTDYTIQADDSLVRERTMPAGITIPSTTFSAPNHRMHYNSRGMPDIFGTARFRNSAGNQLEVVVSNTGRLRIQ